MTFDQAVEAAKSGLTVTRPGFMEEYLGWDHVKCRLYTMDRRAHKAIFTPIRADRESIEWCILNRS